MIRWSRWLIREPLLHFLMLGLLLLAGQMVWQKYQMLFPEVRQLYVSQQDIRKLEKDWHARTGQPASNQQKLALIQQHIDDEILLQEALRLGLHRSDPVVRWRLISNMRFLEDQSLQDNRNTQLNNQMLDTAYTLGMAETDLVSKRRLIQRIRNTIENSVSVSEDEVLDYYNKHTEAFLQPAGYSFRHLFFAQDRDGLDAHMAALNAMQALAQNDTTEPASDPFLQGDRFNHLNLKQIRSRLGEDIAETVKTAAPGIWSGPVPSAYGWHVIRVTAVKPSEPLPFEQARSKAVAAVYKDKEQAAIEQALGRMRPYYEVVIDTAGEKTPLAYAKE